MTVESWKLWLIPFALWGVFVCWNSGYQSGYAEGHQTAWKMSRPDLSFAAMESASDREGRVPSPDDDSRE